MRFKKYIVCGSMIAVLSLGGLIIGNANEKVTTVDGKDVISSYNNLINKDGIEHLILTENNGITLDIYRDRNSGKERVDYYDEDGILVERSIATDFGSSFLTLSQYTNENGEWDYTLTKTLPPKDAVLENKELMKKSMIDGYFEEEFVNGIYGNWKKSNTNGSLVQYSDENNNIYVDSSTGEVVKREIVSKGEVLRTLDVEILGYSQKSIDSIFNIDAPFIKDSAIVGNRNIRSINKGLKIEIEDNSNVEYDSSKGIG